MNNIYKENGYDSRLDYFKSLADDNELELSFVLMLADLLGPNEDFDGLVSACQDAEVEF